MKILQKKHANIQLVIFLVLILTILSCERDLSNDAVLSTYPKNGEVFIDDFSAGMEYYPYADSKQTAFSIDTQNTYNGSSSSMRFDIPNYDDPDGAYAGAIFRDDNDGRNLTEFDALTFWAKTSQGGTSVDNIGFGQDFYGDTYQVSMQNIPFTTNWKKYIIPIPNPAKLTQSQGLFWYAEGPENGAGYTIWIDQVQYEKLGTIGQPRPKIFNGEDITTQGFVGSGTSVTGLTETFNMANGLDQTVHVAPSYFDFVSSDESVATINELGEITVVGPGTTTITATMNGIAAAGSLTLNSLGNFSLAPVPTIPASNVISIFSDAYTNVPIDFYNGYWQPYQTTESDDFEINGDHILNYTNFNFVGNSFTNPTVNASSMTNMHVDIFIPGALDPNAQLKITLRDVGPDGVDGGTDDSNQIVILNNSDLTGDSWNSIDFPLNIANKNNLGLIIYENLGTNLTNLYLDNIYFYEVSTTPTTAAPTPTVPAANVISIFSDAYTNVGSDLNPNWGQTTVTTQEMINGNNTLKYAGLNYQGLALDTSQDVSAMTYLHIDYFTTNSSNLNIYLISPGPVETQKSLAVPTSGWVSLEILLSDFSPVDLTNVFQLKFDGNGDVFVDNIYFHN